MPPPPPLRCPPHPPPPSSTRGGARGQADVAVQHTNDEASMSKMSCVRLGAGEKGGGGNRVYSLQFAPPRLSASKPLATDDTTNVRV